MSKRTCAQAGLLAIVAAMVFAGCRKSASTAEPSAPASVPVKVEKSVQESLEPPAEPAPVEEDHYSVKMREYGLVDIQELDSTIGIDLRYTTTNNFTGEDLYDNLERVFVTPMVGESLVAVQRELKARDPQLSLVIFDCARPWSVQKRMWKVVAGTDMQRYVARPTNGGPHNYGIAVDLTLSRNGEEVDMGTDFDCFEETAHITDEDGLVRRGIISAEAKENRRLLRSLMTKHGFTTYSCEWWHFTRVSMKTARRQFRLLDF